MPTLTDFETGVANRIQDAASKLSMSAVDDCIREAITVRYSRARPIKAIADFVGDGVTYSWAINQTNFPGWDLAFSFIDDIEYPQGSQDPQILDKDEWMIYYPASNAPQLRLLGSSVEGGAVPEAGQTMRVTYSIPHAVDQLSPPNSITGADVPAADFHGVVNLAASLAAGRLQAIYTQLGDQAFGGDAVDYKTKSAQYGQLAVRLNKEFEGAFGLDKDEPNPAASGQIEWREDLEAGGRRLIH